LCSDAAFEAEFRSTGAAVHFLAYQLVEIPVCYIMLKDKTTTLVATALAIGAGLALTYATYSYFTSSKEKNDKYKGMKRCVQSIITLRL